MNHKGKNQKEKKQKDRHYLSFVSPALQLHKLCFSHQFGGVQILIYA